METLNILHIQCWHFGNFVLRSFYAVSSSKICPSMNNVYFTIFGWTQIIGLQPQMIWDYIRRGVHNLVLEKNGLFSVCIWDSRAWLDVLISIIRWTRIRPSRTVGFIIGKWLPSCNVEKRFQGDWLISAQSSAFIREFLSLPIWLDKHRSLRWTRFIFNCYVFVSGIGHQSIFTLELSEKVI